MGVVDFELDDDEKRSSSPVVGVSTSTAATSAASAAPVVDHSRHLVGSLYYPAAAASAQKAHRWSPTFYHTHSYVSFASRMSPDHGTALRKAKTAAFAAVSHGVLLAAGVRVAADAGRAAPPLKEAEAPFPSVVYGHGLGGSRAAYSVFAAALAANGFVVLTIEHADGTAAVAKLAGSRGFKDYERWQPGPEQLRARGEARRAELAVAARVLEALATGGGGGGGVDKGDEGGKGGGEGAATAATTTTAAAAATGGDNDDNEDNEPLRGLSLEGGKLPLDYFVGALRPGAAPAVVGHSFGGALAADAAAGGKGGARPLFSAAAALDPWWGALPNDSRAGEGGASSSSSSSSLPKAPLFVLGSDAWNTPDPATGELFCGREAQERVLRSFARSAPSSSSSSSENDGNGALFAVLKGSSHAGFSDVVSLLPGLSKWFYGRRRRRAAAGDGGDGGAGEAGDSGGGPAVVTEASDPISTARAAAEMTAAFLRRRAAAGGEGQTVTEADREAVEAAARRVGVELSGVRLV